MPYKTILVYYEIKYNIHTLTARIKSGSVSACSVNVKQGLADRWSQMFTTALTPLEASCCLSGDHCSPSTLLPLGFPWNIAPFRLLSQIQLSVWYRIGCDNLVSQKWLGIFELYEKSTTSTHAIYMLCQLASSFRRLANVPQKGAPTITEFTSFDYIEKG